MNFPVFSQLAGNFGFPETGWLETASSSGESRKLQLIGEGSDEEITAEPDRAVQCDATDARRPVDLAPTDRPGRQFEILAASGRKTAPSTEPVRTRGQSPNCQSGCVLSPRGRD